MIRVVLNLYLVLVIAAGPWLCCCTAAQVTSWFGPAPQAAGPACGCCPEEADDRERPADEGSKAPARPCPCEGQRLPVLAASPDFSGSEVKSSAASDAGAVAFAEPKAAAPILSDAPERSDALPRMSGRTLLRALHILRC